MNFGLFVFLPQRCLVVPCCFMRRTNKGSYVSLEWPGWSGPRLFSLSGVEQGRAEEQCASARQILSPRGNFTWPTAQSTNKASGDKKESLARCRPNFIPSSCGNSTRRGRLALAQWVTRRRCAPNRDKFYCRVAISLAWRWHKRVTRRRNLVAQISPTPPIHMLQ